MLFFCKYYRPLYFQHQGHSRTIVGIQRRKKSESKEDVFLLILDPFSLQFQICRASVFLVRGRFLCSIVFPIHLQNSKGMGSPKKSAQSDTSASSKSWSTTSILFVMALCFLCYILGAWQNSSPPLKPDEEENRALERASSSVTHGIA